MEEENNWVGPTFDVGPTMPLLLKHDVKVNLGFKNNTGTFFNKTKK